MKEIILGRSHCVQVNGLTLSVLVEVEGERGISYQRSDVCWPTGTAKVMGEDQEVGGEEEKALRQPAA